MEKIWVARIGESARILRHLLDGARRAGGAASAHVRRKGPPLLLVRHGDEGKCNLARTALSGKVVEGHVGSEEGGKVVQSWKDPQVGETADEEHKIREDGSSGWLALWTKIEVKTKKLCDLCLDAGTAHRIVALLHRPAFTSSS